MSKTLFVLIDQSQQSTRLPIFDLTAIHCALQDQGLSLPTVHLAQNGIKEGSYITTPSFEFQTISNIVFRNAAHSGFGASTGQTPAQVPQSMHSSLLITYLPSFSEIQLTGHSSAHAPQAMQSSVITYAIFSTSLPFDTRLHVNGIVPAMAPDCRETALITNRDFTQPYCSTENFKRKAFCKNL